MTADRAAAAKTSRPVLRLLRQITDALKPRNLSARFIALNASQRTMTVLLAVLLLIVLTTFNRYGFTFDEFKGVLRAKAVLAAFVPNGKTLDASSIDMTHGAAPDVLALVLQNLIPPLSYDSRHLVFALFGVAGVYYLYRFGCKFVGEWVGVFGALFLATTPMWFGHMFINHKDIPFATLLLASTYYSLLALTEQTASRGWWVKAGLAIGLLAATKLAGLLALVFIVAVYVACLATLPSQNKIQLAPNLGRRAAWLGLAAVLGCLFCFLLFWPQVYFNGLVFREAGANSVFAHAQNPFYASTYFIVSTPVYLLRARSRRRCLRHIPPGGSHTRGDCNFCLVFSRAVTVGPSRSTMDPGTFFLSIRFSCSRLLYYTSHFRHNKEQPRAGSTNRYDSPLHCQHSL